MAPDATEPVLPAPRGGADPRDRFLAFAFAAADLLVETDPQGRITFAAGAFRHRLGEAPEAFLGQPLERLIAPEERGALATALQLLAARGRLSPTAIRLNDAARSPFALAGLSPAGAGAGAPGRLCLTLGPLPGPPQAATLAGAVAFGRAAEAVLSQPAPGDGLALLELPRAVETPLSASPELRRAVEAAVLETTGGALAGRLSLRRYGVLTSGGGEALPVLTERLEEVLLAHGLPGGVSASALALEAKGLSRTQATRALRHALSRFAAEGEPAQGGLTGALAEIAAQAGWVRLAVSERRFDLLFQPIVDLRERRPHHHEALLRPGGPGVGALVRCAETVGLTEELDLAVAERVLDALRFAPQARVALNVSGLSVQSAAFRDALAERLGAQPGLARRLMVELTESVEIEDEEQARRTLAMLRDRGVSLCLDDFGAGAAAFRYLKSFRVDWVKVDGAYVREAVRGERDRAFVASMVDLSLAVGARVIAEQVETEPHAEVMAGLGAELGQGYLFGRPAPLPGSAGQTSRRAA